MKRLILSTFLLCAIIYEVSAQKNGAFTDSRIGVALETGLPVGDTDNTYTVGLGGSAKLEIPFSQPFAATFTAGYLSLLVRDELKPLLSDSRDFIPLKAGAKYYFGKNFFGEGEVGASISTEKGEKVALAYAPGIGVSFPVSDQTAIDAGVRYEQWNRDGGNIDQVGFRVVLKF